MATQCPALFDQPAEVGVELGCAARDIDRGNIGPSESVDALLCRFFGHALSPVRPRIDMTMPTGLIAELADIDLKDGNSSGTKRKQTDVIELCLEGRATRSPPEYLQLLPWGGEGVLLSQQGQRHRTFVHNVMVHFGTDHQNRLRNSGSPNVNSSFHWERRSRAHH